jgi:Alcohol dehydrogenase, class IV
MTGIRVHTTLPVRVLIGPGARHEIPAEVRRLGARQVIVVATPSAGPATDELVSDLGPLFGARFDRPVVHTPVAVTAEAMQLVESTGADLVLAIGGGSAIGLGKAISSRTGMPQIAVPTTYAGSELTPTLGETADGVKTTRRDPALAPGTVVYDPELTLSLPARLTLTSVMNALAHAVEALWAPDASAVSDAVATGAAEMILTDLPGSLATLSDVSARARLQEASWLAGLALAQTSMGLQHQLAHVLGAAYDLPHAELHTILLPHVMAYNLPGAPRAAARLARITGADPVSVVSQLTRTVDGPANLAELGVPRADLVDLARRTVAAPYPNPRPVDLDAVTHILTQAWQ